MVVHRREGGIEIRKRNRRMISVSSDSSPSPKIGVDLSDCAASNSFFSKAGRKISVGDCALFKPAVDSPTFVGLILSSRSDKKSNLSLGVKWLYRPAEVKLPEGVALEAAPNEVFYSFHSDEIPVVSLLHPCKVAFLPKGAELPSGVASFVCRRVYDIRNKCLWWLSDEDFIDERQEEIGKLLHRTPIDMHASVGANSPKPPNSPGATSTQKHSPDHFQSNRLSKMKGKKRSREDQSFELIKRGQNASKNDRSSDGDPVRSRFESFLNLEIAKVAESGGLSNSEAVAKLVRLMQPERSQRKIDLTGRSMLAGIIAATDKLEYLTQFIKLNGIVVLDEWLQEVHMGKIVDSRNVKDSDKCVDNFILVLLRALFKLPVNLNVLQMCNIGKSVNFLRSHKNFEIQKKARSLVDTWKKRVEAEMTIKDVKYGSTQAVSSPGRSRDLSHGFGGYRHPGETSEATIRGLVTHQSSLNSSAMKPAQAESKLKSGSTCQSSGKSAVPHVITGTNSKGVQSSNCIYGASSEVPHTVAMEDKSSGSSQSHTTSQGSSGHVKYSVPCGNENVQGSMTGSKSSNRPTSSDSKCRELANGCTVDVHQETAPNRTSLVEKISHNAIDGLVHVGNVHEGNNSKLIVKISNRVRVPVQSIVPAYATGSSCINSIAASPALSERRDESDVCLKKSDEGGGPEAVEEHRTNDTGGSPDVSKAECSRRNEIKLKKAHDSSFSSMNALVETCMELLEADVVMPAGEDFGIILLASVAVGESSGITSPAVLPHSLSTTVDKSSVNNNENEKLFHDTDVIKQEGVSADVSGAADCNNISSVVSKSNDEESAQYLGIVCEDLNQRKEGSSRANELSDAHVTISRTTGRSVALLALKEKGGDSKDQYLSQLPASNESVARQVCVKDKVKGASLYDKSEDPAQMDTAHASIINTDAVTTEERSHRPRNQNLRPVSFKTESRSTDESPVISLRTNRHLVSVQETVNFEKNASFELFDEEDGEGKKRVVRKNGPSLLFENQEDPGVHCADLTMDSGLKDENLDNKEAFLQQSRGLGPQLCSSAFPLPDIFHSSIKENKFHGERSGTVPVNAASLPAIGSSDVVAKHGFDLNECVNVEEEIQLEAVSVAAGPCLPIVCSDSILQVPFASAPGGPSVAPDDLLRGKKEFRWKGSASTSAFHLGEPAKVMEVPLCLTEVPHPDGAACKQERPRFDIDLNVADASIWEDSDFEHCEGMTTASLRSSGGLNFDLNKIEGSEMVQQSDNNILKIETSVPIVRALPSSIFANGKASIKKDFDLNDGPAVEEFAVEQTLYSQPVWNNIPLHSSLGPRYYSPDAGNLIPWNPPGAGYSVSVTPSVLPDREAFPVVCIGGGPHRILGGPTASNSFYPDTYRRPVLASSPAVPFQHTQFQYPVFPFGTGFPLPAFGGGSSGYMGPTGSGLVSAIPSQMGGNVPAVSFQHPYVVSRPFPDVSSNGVLDNNQRWGKQGLDLNSGPGGVDLEGIDGSIPTVSRQVSVLSSQPIVEDQAMMYRMGGGILKRKVPDGGSSMDMLNFKQSYLWR